MQRATSRRWLSAGLFFLSVSAFAVPVDFEISGTLNGAAVSGELRVDDQTEQVLSWMISVAAGPSDSENEVFGAYSFSGQSGDANLSNANRINLRAFEEKPFAPSGSNDNRDFRIDIPVAELGDSRFRISQVAITDCWNCSPFRTGTAVLTARATDTAANSTEDVPPSIDAVALCAAAGEIEFDVQVTGTTKHDFAFRISADNEAFVSPTERIEVNFDAGGAISRGVNPTVATAGATRYDRWQDGPISPFSITQLGNNSYRLSGKITKGSQPFVVGDSVAQVGFRSFGVSSRTATVASVTIVPCVDATGSR